MHNSEAQQNTLYDNGKNANTVMPCYRYHFLDKKFTHLRFVIN